MKKYIFALVVCLMLFLTGCGGGEEAIGGSGTPFIGGTSGLLLNFENSPPPEVFDNGQFPFGKHFRKIRHLLEIIIFYTAEIKKNAEKSL